jgi:hypothetical protein
MAKQNDEKGVAYVSAALNGSHGPDAEFAAATAITTAVEHGYDDDPARVAETLRVLLSDEN